MNRTREIANTPEKGQKRYLLYKAVIEQYKKAKENRFYLEAITLMESIITDRLESALIYHGIIEQDHAFRMLGDCLTKAKNIISDQLFDELNMWRQSRNQALHEIAKIEEGDESSFEQRRPAQMLIAEEGYRLFNKLKKELR